MSTENQWKTGTVTATITLITPDIATEMMKYNQKNRKPRPSHIASLARDMANDRWHMTAEPIKFSREGLLLDGQHRLLACIASGHAFKALVTTGLEPESQDYMDTGAHRELREALGFKGYTNASTLAAVARLVVNAEASLETGNNFGAYIKATNAELVTLIAENPGLIDAARESQRVTKSIMMRSSVIGAGYYLFSNARPDQVDEFFEGLHTMMFESVNDPRARMLSKIVSQKARSGPRIMRGPDQLRMLIHTWNLWINGQEVTRMTIPTKGPLEKISCGKKGVRGLS